MKIKSPQQKRIERKKLIEDYLKKGLTRKDIAWILKQVRIELKR